MNFFPSIPPGWPVTEKTPGFPGLNPTGSCRLNWAHLASHTTNAGRAAVRATLALSAVPSRIFSKRFFEIVIIFVSLVPYNTQYGTIQYYMHAHYGSRSYKNSIIYLFSLYRYFSAIVTFFFLLGKPASELGQREENLDSFRRMPKKPEPAFDSVKP